jgi:hypothetical protein
MSAQVHSDITRVRRLSARILIDSLRDSYPAAGYLQREGMERPSYEVDSRYINAPSWTWAVAGWTISALHVLFFLVAWLHHLL